MEDHTDAPVVAQPICNEGDNKDRLACMREMDEIEERRDQRRMRFWVIRFILFSGAVLALMITSGGLYGWLFKEKEFLDNAFVTFFTHGLDLVKIVFGI